VITDGNPSHTVPAFAEVSSVGMGMEFTTIVVLPEQVPSLAAMEYVVLLCGLTMKLVADETTVPGSSV
jgi:hypothetical protein